MRNIDTVSLEEQRINAEKNFLHFKHQEEELRIDDFEGRVYVNSTIEIFKQRKFWETELIRINGKIENERLKQTSKYGT